MKKSLELGAGVISGYVLGRRRKLKLALAAASWVTGRKLGASPRDLLADIAHRVKDSQEVQDALHEVESKLKHAGMDAVAERVADRLSNKTSQIGGGTSKNSSEDASGSDEASNGPATKAKSTGSAKASSRPASSRRSTNQRRTSSKPAQGATAASRSGTSGGRKASTAKATTTSSRKASSSAKTSPTRARSTRARDTQ